MGADVCTHNNRAIIYASKHGHLSVIKLLIKRSADVKAKNNASIVLASKHGPADLRVISTFCRYYREHLSVIKLLIENGGDVCDRNNEADIISENN